MQMQAELLSSPSSPLPVLRAVVTGDTVRFGSFCGLSVAVYKTALSVLQRRAQHLVCVCVCVYVCVCMRVGA